MRFLFSSEVSQVLNATRTASGIPPIEGVDIVGEVLMGKGKRGQCALVAGGGSWD